MASVTLSSALTVFPSGTTVSVYLAEGFNGTPTTAPTGSVVTTADVDADGLSFSGLANDTAYVAGADVDSDDFRYLRFSTTDETGSGISTPFGSVFYADAVNGDDGNDGSSWSQAKATITAAIGLCSDGDTIYIDGKFREQVAAASVIGLGGISIIGAGTRPRHMDTVWERGGASWMAPASPAATTPLLTIRGQGWRLENIMFDGPSDASCVKLERNAGEEHTTAEYDASHATFKGCRFTQGTIGIQGMDCFNVLVDDCEFMLMTDGTGYGILCSGGVVALPYRWHIRNSRFTENDNHIVAPANKWIVEGCVFDAVGVTTKIDFSGGTAGNTIVRCALGGTYSISGGYTGAGAGDEWGGNFNSLSGGVTAADPA